MIGGNCNLFIHEVEQDEILLPGIITPVTQSQLCMRLCRAAMADCRAGSSGNLHAGHGVARPVIYQWVPARAGWEEDRGAYMCS